MVKTKMASHLERLEAQMAEFHAEQQISKAKTDQNSLMLEQILLRLESMSNSNSSAAVKNSEPSVVPDSSNAESSTTASKTIVMRDKENKGELPVFNGSNTAAWIRQAERFFRLNSIKEEERLDTVVLYLGGAALDWYMWAEDNIDIKDWHDCRLKIEERFRSSDFSSAY